MSETTSVNFLFSFLGVEKGCLSTTISGDNKCHDEKESSFVITGTKEICFCNNKDFCNGVGVLKPNAIFCIIITIAAFLGTFLK